VFERETLNASVARKLASRVKFAMEVITMTLKERRQKNQKVKPTKRLSREDAEGERISRKAMRLYETKLKALLEPAYIGKFAAIEPDSGDYFVADRMTEAMQKARAKHPDKKFFLVRIGFKAAVRFRNPVPLSI
jgi:hypothetical protein